MQSTGSQGVRRPIMYVLVAALAVAMALPLAVASGQSKMGGMFDECFDARCDGGTYLASKD